MPRLLSLAAACAAVLALSAAPALADPGTPDNPKGAALGIVPAHGQAGKPSRSSASNLAYHGGPVMHANSTYAVYWVPAGYSVSSTYQSMINGFLANVASASGLQSNVYFSDTQFYDSSGSIAYSSSFSGSAVDTNQFPASGCNDSYTSVCLSDGQLQSELSKVMAAHGWSGGLNKVYFVFTPRGVGSCAGGSGCAFSSYCAYHSGFGSGSNTVLYANQPYTDTVPGACDSGQSPNGDAAADSTINVVSHEHNESITDPAGSAWYDRRGNENGDKCAWTFGTALGQTGAGAYNQSIGSGRYYLQREWSNRSAGCVLTGI